MPWEHCNHSIADTEPCPDCGIDKTSWTIELEVTRNFQISRRPILKLVLFEGDEEPVGGEPYSVELPDGSVAEGELDEAGYVKVVSPAAGTCTVTFPERTRDGVRRVPDEEGETKEAEEEPEAEDEPEGGDDTNAEGVATFECATRAQRYRFELSGSWVRVPVLDVHGEPLVDARYQLLIDGEKLEGRTSSEGVVEHRVSPDAQKGVLSVWLRENRPPVSWPFRFGPLPEADSVEGLQARLRNLGFYGGRLDKDRGPKTEAALDSFREWAGLSEGTGEGEILNHLRDRHGK